MEDNSINESVFSHRIKLHDHVKKGSLNEDVLKMLIPEGEPIEYERQLWDYKLDFPSLNKTEKSTEAELSSFNGSMSEIIKDIVSFYNSYGGYLVIGISNSPKKIIGIKSNFDCDEINKRVLASTGQQIECFFKKFEKTNQSGEKVNIGLLFIPQRSDGKAPAQFLKDAQRKESGKQPFAKGDIYFRFADTCIQAKTSEDYAFLFTPKRRNFSPEISLQSSPVLFSNMGDRDPGFIQFVGREEYLALLWKWFLDKFNSVKLLAGIGGVGKTALAREFTEQVGRAAPFGFERIIWLSAKRQFYTAINGNYIPSGRVDFNGVDELLREISLELGADESEVNIEIGREALMDVAISYLRLLPAVVVVDDVDSLDPEIQQDVFHTLIAVFGQTAGKSPIGSRALLTARLDLGAAPGQVIRVKGLNIDEFSDFVDVTCSVLDLTNPPDRGSKRMSRFHKVTEGSPTFASSVLRLVALGEGIDNALTSWEGSDGEHVRGFAFERELDQLPDSTRNVLFALCILSESTLVELSGVLLRSVQQIRDDFAELRKYHLIVHIETDLPGGARITAPGSIRMMREILRDKVRDPKKIETSCAKIRSTTKRIKSELGFEIQRVVTLWAQGHAEDAKDLAEVLDKRNPGDPDIKCLLGRAYLRLPEPETKKSEINFRKASELGCNRPELLPLWVEAKASLSDWTGLLEITKFSDKNTPNHEILLARAEAYKQLAEMERRVFNTKTAAERYSMAGKEIDNALRKNKSLRHVLELKQLRKEFLTSHVELIERQTIDPNDYLDVWLAVILCFDCFVRTPRIMRLGAGRLFEWWRAVERREKVAESSARVLDIQLRKLRTMIVSLREQESSDFLLNSELESLAGDLDERLAKYTI
ncbi:RNA-binding domain-containing protein [Janthinobacterium tructae]